MASKKRHAKEAYPLHDYEEPPRCAACHVPQRIIHGMFCISGKLVDWRPVLRDGLCFACISLRECKPPPCDWCGESVYQSGIFGHADCQRGHDHRICLKCLWGRRNHRTAAEVICPKLGPHKVMEFVPPKPKPLIDVKL